MCYTHTGKTTHTHTHPPTHTHILTPTHTRTTHRCPSPTPTLQHHDRTHTYSHHNDWDQLTFKPKVESNNNEGSLFRDDITDDITDDTTCDIDVRDGPSMTSDDMLHTYILPQKPVLLRGFTWNATTSWSKNMYVTIILLLCCVLLYVHYLKFGIGYYILLYFVSI